MNPKALVGIGIAAAAGIGMLVLAEGEASAKPGEKALPGGGTKNDLALATTVSLTTQNIPDIRAAIVAWNAARDPLTAGAIAFTLDGAMAGVKLQEWGPDGGKGSPLLRAFGLRILQLEGRPDLLKIWAKAWKTILPLLSAELTKKAGGIKPTPEGGTTDDPVPPEELVERIEKAVASGDTALMRKLADQLEKLGFKDAAKDLRAAADAIDAQKVEPPPPPVPIDVVSTAPSAPKPSGAPAGGPGRVYVVLPGDNPSKISKKLTGNGNRFPELVRENVPPKKKGKDGGFDKLFAGERLKVPASWPAHPEAVRGTATAAPSAPSSTVSTAPSAPRALPAAPSGQTTVVQKGDGFIRITKRLGQPEARWRELRDANVPRDAGGRSRSKDSDAKGGIKPPLNPGDVLFVPSSWSVAAPAPSVAVPTFVSASPAAAPAPVGNRTYIVKSGDSAARIARNLTGVESRWRELVAANSPPKTKAPDGNFKFLNPGEALKIPASWPSHPDMAMVAGDELGAENMAYRRAGLVGLNAHLGKQNPGLLAEFQRDHGIVPNGEYGPGTALVLLNTYGMVPPTPKTWGAREKANRQKFADIMYQMAKKDPQRRDEFKHAALKALGKVM